MYLSIPVLIGVAINDVNVIINKTLASELIDGSISALNYASRLTFLIQGVFVSAITTVIFPLLAKESNNNNISGMKKIMGHGINFILLITIPAAVGMIVLALPIVQVAFERGAFTSRDTVMTSSALIFYSLGLVASSLQLLAARVYYSLQDTRTPMINGGLSVSMNIVLSLILVGFMDHIGLALATSISGTIAVLLLFYGLKKKIGSLGTKGYITTFIKSGTASLIMGVVVYLVYRGLYGVLGISRLNNLISLTVAAGLGVIIYVILCYAFGIDAVKNAADKARFKLFK